MHDGTAEIGYAPEAAEPYGHPENDYFYPGMKYTKVFNFRAATCKTEARTMTEKATHTSRSP